MHHRLENSHPADGRAEDVTKNGEWLPDDIANSLRWVLEDRDGCPGCLAQVMLDLAFRLLLHAAGDLPKAHALWARSIANFKPGAWLEVASPEPVHLHNST